MYALSLYDNGDANFGGENIYKSFNGFSGERKIIFNLIITAVTRVGCLGSK